MSVCKRQEDPGPSFLTQHGILLDHKSSTSWVDEEYEKENSASHSISLDRFILADQMEGHPTSQADS